METPVIRGNCQESFKTTRLFYGWKFLLKFPCHGTHVKIFFCDFHEKLKEQLISVVLSGSFGSSFFLPFQDFAASMGHGLNRQAASFLLRTSY